VGFERYIPTFVLIVRRLNLNSVSSSRGLSSSRARLAEGRVRVLKDTSRRVLPIQGLDGGGDYLVGGLSAQASRGLSCDEPSPLRRCASAFAWPSESFRPKSLCASSVPAPGGEGLIILANTVSQKRHNGTRNHCAFTRTWGSTFWYRFAPQRTKKTL
jgi:hypothetical protein